MSVTAIEEKQPTLNKKPVRARKPTHPGKFLLREILRPNKLSISEAARRLDLERKDFSLFLMGKRRCTPKLAKRLSVGTGTSVDIWLNLQNKTDIWLSNQISAETVKPLL